MDCEELVSDPVAAAKSGGLHYVGARGLGMSRLRSGTGFAYRDRDGHPVRDPRELRRIQGLAVPPAWTEVWISPDPLGHLQATGRDARGRMQYRYHPRWRDTRDETKYAHMRAFGAALPRIRRRVARDLGRPGLPREKVLAAVVRLMERTLARIGNPEYARDNHSFGLTTLQNRHVKLRGGRIELEFRAKAGIRHHSVISDGKLARILRRCRDLPGSELFQYLDDDGARRCIGSEDVNEYLRTISGAEITAKDFRTWAASNLALLAIMACGDAKPTKRRAAEIVRQVAEQLGNTPAVCRKCYIHPGVMAAWHAGTLGELGEMGKTDAPPETGLWAVERALLRFLARHEATASSRGSRAATMKALRASLGEAATA